MDSYKLPTDQTEVIHGPDGRVHTSTGFCRFFNVNGTCCHSKTERPEAQFLLCHHNEGRFCADFDKIEKGLPTSARA